MTVCGSSGRPGEMTTPAATLVDSLASLELEQSQPRVYDRPIHMRLL